MGLELFSPDEDSSAVVTAVRMPDGIDADVLLIDLRDRFGITFAPGQGPLKGRILRIGHIGFFDVFDITTALAGLELGLAEAERTSSAASPSPERSRPTSARRLDQAARPDPRADRRGGHRPAPRALRRRRGHERRPGRDDRRLRGDRRPFGDEARRRPDCAGGPAESDRPRRGGGWTTSTSTRPRGAGSSSPTRPNRRSSRRLSTRSACSSRSRATSPRRMRRSRRAAGNDRATAAPSWPGRRSACSASGGSASRSLVARSPWRCESWRTTRSSRANASASSESTASSPRTTFWRPRTSSPCTCR